MFDMAAIDPNAVDLQDPVGIGGYIGLALILYAIRETHVIPNRFIPVIGIALGLGFAWIQYGFFNGVTLEAGLRLGLLGIGSVATIRYLLEQVSEENKDKLKDKENK